MHIRESYFYETEIFSKLMRSVLIGLVALAVVNWFLFQTHEFHYQNMVIFSSVIFIICLSILFFSLWRTHINGFKSGDNNLAILITDDNHVVSSEIKRHTFYITNRKPDPRKFEIINTDKPLFSRLFRYEIYANSSSQDKFLGYMDVDIKLSMTKNTEVFVQSHAFFMARQQLYESYILSLLRVIVDKNLFESKDTDAMVAEHIRKELVKKRFEELSYHFEIKVERNVSFIK